MTPGIDPDELAITLKVLSELQELHPDHDDVRTVKRAASYMYKMIKKTRRAEIRAIRFKHDQDIIEKTATGSALRIDDETAGIPLVSSAAGAFAGELITARGCYICKQDFTLVDAFYHWLCPTCAAFSHSKRDARADLTGRRALLTGGRAKIGMYITLRLLRDGAHTTITTRFPKDAARRFAAMEDSADWLHRLRIVGIDLRDPSQVMALTDSLNEAGPLDIIINNAAQTVRRSGNAYKPLVDAEDEPLPEALEAANGGPELVTFGHAHDKHPLAITHSVTEHPVLAGDAITSLALSTGSASLERIATGTAI